MTTSAPDREVFISAADANRGFSRVLREVREGVSYVVTSHGRPVARVIPFDGPQDPRSQARAALFEHLQTVKALEPGVTWTRDELHDDVQGE